MHLQSMKTQLAETLPIMIFNNQVKNQNRFTQYVCIQCIQVNLQSALEKCIYKVTKGKLPHCMFTLKKQSAF